MDRPTSNTTEHYTNRLMPVRAAWPIPHWMWWMMKRFYKYRTGWFIPVPGDGIYRITKIDESLGNSYE